MKSVLISIQPKWVEKIGSGEKTIEVRKSRPKLETPFKCYIYETNWKDNTYWKNRHKGKLGKVIGEFVCDKITDISVVVRNCNENYNEVYHNDECKGSYLTWKELQEYGKGKTLYGWHISNLVIYDKPKELGEFTPFCKFKNERCELCICYEEVFGGCCRVLKRPPQSWCYVEEKQDER